METETAETLSRMRSPGATERSSNLGKVSPKLVYDLSRDTWADGGTVINRIRSVVPSPVNVHFLSDGRETVGKTTPLGRPEIPTKRMDSIEGLSRRTFIK